jgi:hypothetical protein
VPKSPLKINRFTVMAILQAARAQSLGLPREAAYSWGLNRAIFYAAAKRGFKSGSPTSGASAERPKESEGGDRSRELYRLGEDEAYRNPQAKDLVFRIGDKDQTAEDFQRQIADRFRTKENFRAVWDEAMRIVGAYDRPALESPSRFYGEVYKPRRDDLVSEWTEKYAAPTTPK